MPRQPLFDTPSAMSRPGGPGWRLRRLATVLLGLGLAASAPALQAQSLLELYQAARAFDATYLAARAQADSAPFRRAQADALRRPTASLNADLSTSQSDPPNFPRIGSTNASVELLGQQSLYNRVNGVTLSQAEKQLELSVHVLETAEQDLILRVSQAYFDVLGAQDTLATTKARKTAISEQLASAKRNFEVGTATITDTREAQALFDLATAQEIAADNDLRSKRVVLDQLVGRSQVEPKQLIVPVALPALVPADIEAWAQRADATHPAIRRAQIGLDLARLETERARAGHSPTVGAFASLRAAQATGSGPARNFTKGTTTTGSIGVQLNLPLYTGGLVENQVKESLVLEEKSRNDLEAARRAVSQTTRTAFLAVQSGQAQVKALEAAEASNLLAVEATLLGYRVGVRVNLDVLNAQTQLFTTRRDLAQARYNVLLASLRLRQASGRLAPDDVAALEPLLKK